MTMWKMALTALLVLMSITAPAVAADIALGCFVRVYDRAHLARHPDQTVTAMRLRIKRPDRETSLKYDFALSVRVRGRDDSRRAGGSCREEEPGLHCFVECDGGGIRVAPRGDHAMVHLERIRVAACGEDYAEGGDELAGGKDDRDFRLYRVGDAACAGMKP
jgi:hypothetical protein